MLYAFAVFLVLCGIAVLGQWLTYNETTARAASLRRTENRVALIAMTTDAAVKSGGEYEDEKGLQLSQNDKLSEAIAIAGSVAESCSDGHRAKRHSHSSTRKRETGMGRSAWPRRRPCPRHVTPERPSKRSRRIACLRR